MNRTLRSGLIATVGATLVAVGATHATAATITVDTLSDSIAPGHCTLRDAMTAANVDSKLENCVPGGPSNTIVFASGLSGTLTLSSALPDIVRPLTIEGPSTGGITISGDEVTDLISIASDLPPGSNLPVTLVNLTFVDSKTFSGATAINNYGALTIENCTFSDNVGTSAGAIVSLGSLSIANSTFAFNSSLFGGAVALRGGPFSYPSSIINSTFYANSAYKGGAIYNLRADLTIKNTTFYANLASDSGAALYTITGTGFLRGSILAGSTGSNCDGPFPDAGYNISDDSFL